MAIKKMPIAEFVEGLQAAVKRKDGYIMGAKGQDPKKWATTSWWYAQYKGTQRTKALEWRKTAERVWDCNGMAEGLYEDFSGVNINTKARYNYSGWCGTKGKGIIPTKYRVPGAAVFWGDTASSIHHVAYLEKPVDEGNPAGDWHIIEAQGVMKGVKRNTLLSRKPNFWGLMTKYFDYENVKTTEHTLGDRTLRNGDEGEDVKALQTNLIRLGYSCGEWGADGDFGDTTEIAVENFQRGNKLVVDGIYGAKSHTAMEKAMATLDTPVDNPKYVKIVGGNCWMRSEPNTTGEKIALAVKNKTYRYGGETAENGWNQIDYDGRKVWVSGKYSEVVK